MGHELHYTLYLVELTVSDIEEEDMFDNRCYIPIKHFREDLEYIKNAAIKVACSQGYNILGTGAIYKQLSTFKEVPPDLIDVL